MYHESIAPPSFFSLGREYDGTRIRVESEIRDHLAWLAEFLLPQFRKTAPGDCEYDIRLIVDRELYETVLARGPRDDERLDTFGMDGTVEQLPRWNGPARETVVFDDFFKVFCGVSADRRRVRVITAAADILVLIHLMRVVREYAMTGARRRQRLLLHAAAFEVGGRGLIIAGEKEAGKTTLLISLLREAGARYISNDRVLVDTRRAKPLLRGMPTIISIRTGPLEISPDVRRRLATTLVFPATTEDPIGLRLEPLARAEAARRLAAVLFGVRVGRTSTLFGDEPLQDDALTDRSINELTSSIGAFECRLGPDAHAREDMPRRLLERLAG